MYERFANSPDKPHEKPPLGLRPREIAIIDRMQEIESAMKRFMEYNMLLPQEWLDEYGELRDKLIQIQSQKGSH